MENDLISRKALLDTLQNHFGQDLAYLGEDLQYCQEAVQFAPSVDAEPVRHGRCDSCKIKETGHGIIELCGNGWQVCIRQQGPTFDLVINHRGDQIALPIEFCPWCGAKMDGGAENG